MPFHIFRHNYRFRGTFAQPQYHPRKRLARRLAVDDRSNQQRPKLLDEVRNVLRLHRDSIHLPTLAQCSICLVKDLWSILLNFLASLSNSSEIRTAVGIFPPPCGCHPEWLCRPLWQATSLKIHLSHRRRGGLPSSSGLFPCSCLRPTETPYARMSEVGGIFHRAKT